MIRLLPDKKKEVRRFAAGKFMKICMYSIDKVFGNGTGGVRRFRELLNTFAGRGENVYLYSADSNESIAAAGFNGRSILGENSSQSKSMAGLKAAFGNKELFNEIKGENFDRVVVFDIRAAFSLVVNGISNINLFLRQDAVSYKRIQLEDNKTNALKREILLLITKATESLCFKKADKIVVQCRFDLNEICKRHPLLKKRIIKKSYVQINNVNPSWIAEEKEKSGTSYDLAFIGNFKDFRKGHDLLLKALKDLADDGISIHTAIIGDGKRLEESMESCRKYKSIEFLGRLSDPIPVLKSSKLLIVPSYADSCPNTVLEGLYYEVPVIGSNMGGIPEILNNSDWLFDMNIESIKTNIVSALDERNNMNLKEKQAKRKDELVFDWGCVMAGIVVDEA